MTNAPLRVVFAGTPEFAASHLSALVDSKHQLAAVYTQPDRRAGRGRQLQASPVKQVALDHGLPVMQPPSLKGAEAQAGLAALDTDVLVVVAYGLILPQVILDTPRLGCLNVHASLLPRWRGAAPIQRAIEAGDDRTGITIMQMDAGLDTGAMLANAACPISPTTTSATLHETLAALGPPLLLEVLDNIEHYRAGAVVQDDAQANYASKIHKSEAQLDWSRDAHALDRMVRAFNPAPVCFTLLAGKRVRIWQAQARPADATNRAPGTPGTIVECGDRGIVVRCGEGDLILQTLQQEGGKAMEAAALLRAQGDRFAPGVVFESPAPPTAASPGA